MFHSFIELKDISLLFGIILLLTIIILFILKYDKQLKLKLEKIKKMPEEYYQYIVIMKYQYLLYKEEDK